MKITVITGSPRKNGTSFLLADEFIKGAKEAGHEIYRFDAAEKKPAPCIACNGCDPSGVCVVHDSMDELTPKVKEADVLVFVSPTYFMSVSAQIKAAIDRFYAYGPGLSGKKAVLLATSHSPADEVMGPLVGIYENMVKYLGWEDCGRILADGCAEREDIEATDFPKQAYELGKSIS
jgi:multimeric flavodoxin WrbA